MFIDLRATKQCQYMEELSHIDLYRILSQI